MPGYIRSIAHRHTPGLLAPAPKDHSISGHYCSVYGSFIQVGSFAWSHLHTVTGSQYFRPLLQGLRFIHSGRIIHLVKGSLPGFIRSIAPRHTPGSLAPAPKDHSISGHYCRVYGSFIQVGSFAWSQYFSTGSFAWSQDHCPALFDPLHQGTRPDHLHRLQRITAFQATIAGFTVHSFR